MHRHLSGWRGILMLIPTIVMWSACANDPTGAVPPVVAPEDMLIKIETNPRGIVLAVGDTQQLVVTARNVLGNTIPIDDSVLVTYTSANIARVSVSPTGLIRGVSVTQSPTAAAAPVRIIARWTHGTITRADSIYVIVTLRPAQPIVAMSIQPSPYPRDSTWVANGSSKRLAVKGFTASGDSVSNLYAYLYTSRRRRLLSEWVLPQSITVGPNSFPTVFWVYATASIYGVAFQDSLRFTSTDPVQNLFDPFRFTLNSTGTISTMFANGGTWYFSPCATIQFQNSTTIPLTVTFDDPSKTGVCTTGDQTGNFTLTATGTTGAVAARKFPTVGLVRWTVTRNDGIPIRIPPTGQILIRDHTHWEALP